jgi:kexin
MILVFLFDLLDFHKKLPTPSLDGFFISYIDDFHGTRCAGEIAAVKNDVCGLGVAYTAKIAGT